MAALRKCTTDLIETDVDDETIIVSLRRGELFSLKETGLAIWNMIDGKRGRSELIDALVDRYGGDRKRIGREAGMFLDEMRAAGLIE